MTVQTMVILLLVLGLCVFASLFAGLIAFGIGRLIKTPMDKAIGWGGIASFSVMALSLTVLAIVVTLVG
ncbi:hypothetical protein ACIPSE_46625 [Streptomyces sp. NPDC090106]|uniref:hypothetical protein n=1 Tax=Streptomyces sp. NPDC090106 TaxID=3365946 RepID=UPI003803ACEC